MNPFRQLYLVFFLILIGGIGGSLVTPLGGDERIGNISAGVAVGTLIALLLVRLTQLRVNERSVISQLDYHGRHTGLTAPPITLKRPSAQEFEIVTDRGDGNQAPQDLGQQDEDPIEVEAPVVRSVVNACSCVCECGNEADRGFEGMCADCRGNRLQELLVCDCDITADSPCKCGALSHWPDPDYAAVALAS